MRSPRWWLPGFFLLITGLWTGCTTSSPTRPVAAGPWDSEVLGRVPARSWGVQTGLVQEVWYAGEPYRGAPTEVFGYLGRPEGPAPAGGRWPGMVLVHGGGGKAFREWAEHWARRGYIALAMDLSGNGPSGRLPNGGPDQSDAVKFRAFTVEETREMWTYHAVSAVILGHSLLRSLPEVDADRTGITGISWGGYLTCIVAGIDPRLKVAVPVYGCGYLGENSVWTTGSLAAMPAEARARWLALFDPSQYLSGVRCPILFLNGTTDFAYPLDSYRKSYRLVPEPYRFVSVNLDLPHGHIWTFPEVDAFVDGALRGGPRLVQVGEGRVRTDGAGAATLEAEVRSGARPVKAQLCYTTDTGPWQKRSWKVAPARVEGRRLAAELPPDRPLVAFVGVTDARGWRTSGEHVELER